MTRRYIWVVLMAAVAIGALGIRMAGLDRRPMHHDEANQAVRFGMLQETGKYTYDPVEHHGPSLYYVSLPFAWLTSGRDFAGTSEITFRMVPVLAGVGLVLLLLLVVDGVGWPAAVFSGLLTAVSPAMVYYSRFYIQEMILVFFTFGAIACGWRCVRSRKLGWAVASGLCLGIMHATKETCVIAYAAMIPAGIIAAYGRFRAPAFAEAAADKQVSGVAGRAGPSASGLKKLGVAAIVSAALISILFYSSFFTNWRGVIDSFLSYKVYLNRAGAAGDHIHPWYYYLKMLAFSRYGSLAWSEGFIIALALVGCVGAVFPKRADFAASGLLRFVALYTVLLAAAYSIIPYKTPWCMVSFLQGMIVLAGVGAVMLVGALRRIPAKAVIVMALLLGCANLGKQARLATTRYCADSRNPYVYSQTSMDFLKLAKRLDQIAAVSPEGRSMLVAVVTNPHDCWPLPWYLRGFSNVGYWTDPDALPELAEPSILVVSPEPAEFEEAVARSLKVDYQTEFYGLRPDAFLSVYIRRDLWTAFLTKVGEGK